MGDYFQTNRTPYPKLRHIMGIRKVSEIKNTLNQITIHLEKSYFPVINKIINLEKIYAHIQTQDGDNPFALIGESRTIQLLLAYIVKVKDLEAVIDDIRSDLSTLPPVCTEWFENTLELIKLDQLKNG